MVIGNQVDRAAQALSQALDRAASALSRSTVKHEPGRGDVTEGLKVGRSDAAERSAQIAAGRGSLVAPGRSLAEELITERRAEAAADDQARSRP